MTDEDTIEYWLDCARGYETGTIAKEHALKCLTKAKELAEIQGANFDAVISSLKTSIEGKSTKKKKCRKMRSYMKNMKTLKKEEKN